MNFKKGIEGDYLETKENLIFDIKGIHHPKDRKICFIRFYPTSEGERLRDGLKYKKIYKLKERFEFLRKNYPKYLFYSPQLDLELQGVNIKDIKKIYTPRKYFQKLENKETHSNIEQDSLDLCYLFIKESNFPKDSIGITGSPMVGLNKEDSDIDLIIYGTENSLNFQSNLENLFNKDSNDLRKYTLHEYKEHYQWRAGGSGVAFEDFLKTEKRKLHQGKYREREFFIRYLKSPEDWKGTFYDYKYKDFGRIKAKAKIIDANYSIFTPCEYKIAPFEILAISKEINFNDVKKNLRYINSFRGRFCEQAREQEKVLVEGKLEKVFYKDNQYFRILLTEQTKDKMILLD